jgi:DNA-binding NarL/FixJ family response regulator
VTRLHPDVALLDVRMPLLDGVEATRQICATTPATRVLILTTFGADADVFAALQAGASGFLLKDSRAEDLLEAVVAVAAGESRLDPAVTAAVMRHFRDHQAPVASGDALSALTPREVDVLRALARGLSNAEIAAELHLSPGTVKTHVASILAKLGARDRVQAVIAAYEAGLAGT